MRLMRALHYVGIAVTAAGCAAADPNAPDSAPGLDLERRVVTIGLLNDESGPGAAIGRPYAIGKRILAAQVNAGGSGLLPEGWTIQLVERDHGYNPQRSVQAYNEIRDRVFFVGHSFGTPNTLPLQPMLRRDQVVAFPASLATGMSKHEYTPPLGASYALEGMRALEWAIEQAGGPDRLKAGVVYQQDDYGQDGLDGWRQAARYHGVRIVSEQAVAPGQTDMTAVISTLRSAGADYVLIATLSSATGAILGTAAQLGYQPTWLGNLASWVDRFFDPQVIPPSVFDRYYWVNGLPFWGEDRPGMPQFLEAFERFRPRDAAPDYYILVSYLQGLSSLEALRRMLETRGSSREAYLAAIRTMEAWEAGGLIDPVAFTEFPYVTGTRVRVLRPRLAVRSWEVVSDFATPQSFATE